MKIACLLAFIILICDISFAMPYDKDHLDGMTPQLSTGLMASGYFENISMIFNADRTLNVWVLYKSENDTVPALAALLSFYALTCRNVDGVRDLTIYIGNQELSLGYWTCKREWIDYWPESLSKPSDKLAAASIITQVQKTIVVEKIGDLPAI